VYPDTPALSPLLSAWGRAIPLADEAQFEAATVSAAIYGWAQALIRDSTAWAAASGVEQAAARSLMARTFVAAGRMIDEQDAAVDDLLAQVVTPGGITEAGLRHLDESGMPEAWRGACDAVLRRLRDRS
jgi:pyrroline-5-carboxylate reductase